MSDAPEAASAPGSDDLAGIAGRAASDKLARDVVAFKVGDRLPLAEVFLICSADNERQAAAIARNIEEQLLRHGRKVLHREGERDGDWLLLDFGELVVHLMQPEAREHYSLERLWKDCPQLDLGLAVDGGGLPASAESSGGPLSDGDAR